MRFEDVSGSDPEYFNYTENNSNILKLIDIKAIDSYNVSVLLINTVLTKVRFLKISSFNDSGQIYLIEKVLKRPNLSINELLGARL